MFERKTERSREILQATYHGLVTYNVTFRDRKTTTLYIAGHRIFSFTKTLNKPSLLYFMSLEMARSYAATAIKPDENRYFEDHSCYGHHRYIINIEGCERLDEIGYIYVKEDNDILVSDAPIVQFHVYNQFRKKYIPTDTSMNPIFPPRFNEKVDEPINPSTFFQDLPAAISRNLHIENGKPIETVHPDIRKVDNIII